MNIQRNFLNDLATNPLLQDIPAPRSDYEWGAFLDYNPMQGAGRAGLTVKEATQLTENIRDIFVATEQIIEMTVAAHRILWEGLVQRDPRRYIGGAEFQHLTIEQRSKLPFKPVDPSGMLVMGITQQGKSRFVQRFGQLLPQVIDRDGSVPGMKAMKQLVYLVVPMPVDKSRKGFLFNALMAMDGVLGSSYASENTSRRSIEQLTEQLLRKLADHCCGLLILEEAQESNGIVMKNAGSDFAGLFMRILNAGLPMMVVGNPMAFKDLFESHHSQTLARFHKGGVFVLDPPMHWTDPEWADDLVPTIWSATVLNEADEPVADLAERLWKKTGGFRHLLAPMRQRCLVLALERGSDRVTLEIFEEMMEEPFGDSDLCDAFAGHDFTALSKCRDIPWKYFRDEWREAGYLPVNPEDAPSAPAGPPASAPSEAGPEPKVKATTDSGEEPKKRRPDAAKAVCGTTPSTRVGRGAVEPHEQAMLDFMRLNAPKQRPGGESPAAAAV